MFEAKFSLSLTMTAQLCLVVADAVVTVVVAVAGDDVGEQFGRAYWSVQNWAEASLASLPVGFGSRP